MTHALVLLLALLIGVIAGLRALTAPAAVAWAASVEWIDVSGTWASWVGNWVTVAILTILAAGELLTDPLPKTPSRKNPTPFTTRLITGGFTGAVIGTAWGYPWGALGAGIVGAALGTVGGYEARKRLTATNKGRDLPVALAEDVVAVGGGLLIVCLASAL